MNFAAGQKRERRLYENTALVAVREERVIALFWTRRGRKSTTLGNIGFDVLDDSKIGFDELSVSPGRTVIAASASLLLGTELVSMTTTATEQAFIVAREAAAMRSVFESRSSTEVNEGNEGLNFKCANSETGKVYGGLSSDDFSDLYQSKRLEMRLYFDGTNYSRLLVIAPNPLTARGWGGTVVRDEAGFTRPALEVELQKAVDPIFRTDPTFKMIYGSNLGPDDRHPFFEMTMPPPEMEFPANPAGHFYRGTNRVLIHRVSLADAYAAGHVLYGNRGEALSYEEFCSDPGNRMQLAQSYQLIHASGGTATIDLVAMLTAQKRGVSQGHFCFVEGERDFQRAVNLMRELLTDGQVGIGFDVASTTGETSNPSSVTITERKGSERLQRLVVLWKEKKPQIVRERLKQLVTAIRERREGGPGRRLCIDASNERLFAEETADELGVLIPVELVVSGSTVVPTPAGYTEDRINYKTWLGDMYSAAVNDGRYSMPASDYLKQDHRLVVKNAGRYECDPQPDGKHGDTFDSGKLAEYALMAGEAGPILPPSGRRAEVMAERRGRALIG